MLKFLSVPDARLWPLLVTLAFVMCGMTVPSPVLPQFATELAGDPALASLAVSVFGFARLVSNWPAGVFSEAVGRQPLLVAGPLLMAISGVVAALSTTFSLLLVSRVLLGVGSAISMTVAMAAIADMSTRENRGRAMALVQGGALTGWAVGPAIGGFAAALWGYAAPFWLQAGMMAVAGGVVFCFQKETRIRVTEARGQSLAGVVAMVRDIGFIAACVVTFSIFFDRTALSQYLMPLAGKLEYGMEPGAIGIGMTLIAIGNAMCACVHREVDRQIRCAQMACGGGCDNGEWAYFVRGRAIEVCLSSGFVHCWRRYRIYWSCVQCLRSKSSTKGAIRISNGCGADGRR